MISFFSHVGLDWTNHVEANPEFMRPTEIGAARGDYSKAKAELGWQPQTTFEALIKLMVDADISRLSEIQVAST